MTYALSARNKIKQKINKIPIFPEYIKKYNKRPFVLEPLLQREVS
jgi:hypothetical protein